MKQIYREITLLLFAIVIIPGGLSGQSNTTTLSLNVYLDQVLTQNPSLKANEALSSQYQAERDEAAAMYGPEVSAGLRFFPDIDEYGLDRRYRSNITVTQPLFTKRSRRKALMESGAARKEISNAKLESTKQRVVYENVIAYFNALIAQTDVRYIRQLIDISQQHLSLLKRRRKEGEARALDILEVEESLLNFQLELRERDEQRLFLLEQLSRNSKQAILMKSLSNEWILMPDIPDSITQLSHIDLLKILSYYQENLDAHQDIRIIDKTIAYEQVQQNLAATYYPDVNASISYSTMGHASPFERDSWGFRIWLDMPLFFYKLDNYRKQQHIAATNRLYFERLERKGELSEDVKQAITNFEQIRQRYVYLNKQRELALEKVRLTEAAKRFGQNREKYMYPDILAENYIAWQQLVHTNHSIEIWHYQISLAYLDLLYASGFLQTDAPYFRTHQQEVIIPKAMWIYDNSWVKSPIEQDVIVRLCQKRHIETVFLNVGLVSDSLSIYNSPIAYNDMIGYLQNHKIKVELLFGDALWIFPELWKTVKDRLNRLAAFANVQIHPDGLHLDIKPYLLPGWNESEKSRQIFLLRYLKLLGNIQEYIQRIMPEMQFTVDIPTWYETEQISSWEKGEHLLSRIMPLVDGITVTAPLAEPAEIRTQISEELLQARINRKRIIVGLDMTSDELPAGMQPSNMKTLDSIIESLYDFYHELFPELVGFAFYKYDDYKMLKQ
ncbi:TolC family protein [candidate division KSB1 bacterium]|nr:TolC family protein [candidate division KSB1 bacterium]